MFKNISNCRLVLIVGIFVLIAVSGLLVYLQKNKNEKIANGSTSAKREETLYDENIIPEWATYTNSTMGYTIEYPKNILPFVGFGDASNVTIFYKTTIDEKPHLGITMLASRGMSVPEWNKTFLTQTLKKITISGVDADVYVITDSQQHPGVTGIQLVKDGVFYSIGFWGLSSVIVDHIINSFHINFVPASMKLY